MLIYPQSSYFDYKYLMNLENTANPIICLLLCQFFYPAEKFYGFLGPCLG